MAVMLTLSSPPVSDLEIQLRARSIREAIEGHRSSTPLAEVKLTPATEPGERWTGVLVYPSAVARSYVVAHGTDTRRAIDGGGSSSRRRHC